MTRMILSFLVYRKLAAQKIDTNIPAKIVIAAASSGVLV